MTFRRNLLGLVGATVLAASLSLPIGASFAAPVERGIAPATVAVASPLSPDVIDQLNAKFDELGVDPAKREGLFAKIANGEPLDSSTGVAPIESTTYREGITDYTRDVFEDGSVSLTSVEHPTVPTSSTDVATRGVGGCTYSLSAGVASWSNCKVEKDNGILEMWYHAGYWRASGGSYGTSITNTWDWDLVAVGATCTKDYLGNPTSTKSRMRANCSVLGGLGTGNPYLDLDITSSNVAVSANW